MVFNTAQAELRSLNPKALKNKSNEKVRASLHQLKAQLAVPETALGEAVQRPGKERTMGATSSARDVLRRFCRFSGFIEEKSDSATVDSYVPVPCRRGSVDLVRLQVSVYHELSCAYLSCRRTFAPS